MKDFANNANDLISAINKFAPTGKGRHVALTCEEKWTLHSIFCGNVGNEAPE